MDFKFYENLYKIYLSSKLHLFSTNDIVLDFLSVAHASGASTEDELPFSLNVSVYIFIHTCINEEFI